MQPSVARRLARLRRVRLSPGVTPGEYAGRIKRVRRTLRHRRLDAGIAYGSEWRPGDTGWLTGYDPHIESTICIIGPEKTLVLGGPEGMRYALETMKTGEYRNFEELKIPDEDYPGFTFERLDALLKEACGRTPRRIGLLTLKATFPLELAETIARSSRATLVDASDILLELRYRKSPAELAAMRTAAEITSAAMQVMLDNLEPRMRELELAAIGDYVMKYLGADRLGVVTQVQSGPRVVTLIGRATNRVIEKGDFVGIGVSARHDGLASCVRRTVVAGGRPSAAQRDLLEKCTHAFELSTPHFRYRGPARAVDRTSRGYLRQFGVEMLYSQVHNIGWTECQEGFGAATQYSRYRFPKGIAAQLDLGVYGVPAFGVPAQQVGFTLEDPYIIDHDGRTHRLTAIPTRAYRHVPGAPRHGRRA